MPEFLYKNKSQLAGIQNQDYADFFIELTKVERTCLLFSHQKGEENSKDNEDNSIPDKYQINQPGLKLSELFHFGKYQFDIRQCLASFKEHGIAQLPKKKTTYLAISRVNYIVQLFQITESQFLLLQKIKNNPSIIKKESLDNSRKRWVATWKMNNFFSFEAK